MHLFNYDVMETFSALLTIFEVKPLVIGGFPLQKTSNPQLWWFLVSLNNRLFRRRSKKTSKLRVTGLSAGNSPVTGEFPAQMASNAEKNQFDDVIMRIAVLIWRHRNFFLEWWYEQRLLLRQWTFTWSQGHHLRGRCPRPCHVPQLRDDVKGTVHTGLVLNRASPSLKPASSHSD